MSHGAKARATITRPSRADTGKIMAHCCRRFIAVIPRQQLRRCRLARASPSLNGDKAPDGLDDAERPGALEETVH